MQGAVTDPLITRIHAIEGDTVTMGFQQKEGDTKTVR